MDIFDRLATYYQRVTDALAGNISAASVFLNSTDVGTSIEEIYAEFLRRHLPSSCEVNLGGFVFDENSSESKQLDVIITGRSAPRFSLGGSKFFYPLEGTIGVVSIKSRLNKSEISDALSNIASIPSMGSLDGKVPITFSVPNYRDWPYRFVLAKQSINSNTLQGHIDSYYKSHPEIPDNRKHVIIQVLNDFALIHKTNLAWGDQKNKSFVYTNIDSEYVKIDLNSDVFCISNTVNDLTTKSIVNAQMIHDYTYIPIKAFNSAQRINI